MEKKGQIAVPKVKNKRIAKYRPENEAIALVHMGSCAESVQREAA